MIYTTKSKANFQDAINNLVISGKLDCRKLQNRCYNNYLRIISVQKNL